MTPAEIAGRLTEAQRDQITFDLLVEWVEGVASHAIATSGIVGPFHPSTIAIRDKATEAREALRAHILTGEA